MKKLSDYDRAPAQVPGTAPGAPGAAPASAVHATAGAGLRRVRSRHHRHHRFRMESLSSIRHREDVRALAFILPLMLTVIGLAIFGMAFRNPDPSMRPAELLSLSYVMIALGGGWLLFSSGASAYRTWREARRQAAEDSRDDEDYARYRSGSRHHRRHHRHSSSERD